MRPYVQTISYNCEMINKEALGEDINYKTFSDSITISKFLNIYKKMLPKFGSIFYFLVARIEYNKGNIR